MTANKIVVLRLSNSAVFGPFVRRQGYVQISPVRAGARDGLNKEENLLDLHIYPKQHTDVPAICTEREV
jgi:hypothetical protein